MTSDRVEDLGRMNFPKLRSWNDFMFGGARFQMPDYRNLQRWDNRICNNLLYYQSNYFIVIGIFFLIAILLNPYKAIVGYTVIAIKLCTLINYKTVKEALGINAGWFYAAAAIVAIIFCREIAYGLIFVLVAMFASLIHASLRLRNIRNRTTNFIGDMRKTPIGMLLALLAVRLSPED